MDFKYGKLVLSGAMLLSLPLLGSAVYAAQPVNLIHQNISILQSFISPAAAKSGVTIKEISRNVDFKNTLHVRIQQTYMGYNVWGADAVVHIPNGVNTPSLAKGMLAAKTSTMNGTVYQGLPVDLAGASKEIFTEAQAQKALQRSISDYQHQTSNISNVTEQQSTLIVFMDTDKKAHWAYKVSFRAESNQLNEKPVKPVSIVDAKTLKVYVSWDDIKTLEKTEVEGGGFAGNKKIGKLIHDGLEGNLAKLIFTRDSDTCYLKNSDVVVKDYKSKKVMKFDCAEVNPDHNNLYWDEDFDKVNDGFSPGNDALFGGQVIKHMYNDWYGMPVLKNADGTPMILTMIVHQRKYDNAYWDGKQMTFGDGYTMFYPLTSLGVAAHEISHGFTEQHSNLAYYGQSGGMNEAYSDMAAQAAEVYAYGVGKNSWQIGPEIFKAENEALRYMDKPSKDCGEDKQPGDWCSIDDASQYSNGLDVHFSSGVYNRFFYTLGTTEGWDARKAFDVMIHANSNYWTSSVSFSDAACGVISAAKDLNYDIAAVKAAFDVVKVDYSSC